MNSLGAKEYLKPARVLPIIRSMNIKVPLNDEEWSLLNAAADSIASSPEELARLSLMQRCMVMSEDNDVCKRTREMIGLSFAEY